MTTKNATTKAGNVATGKAAPSLDASLKASHKAATIGAGLGTRKTIRATRGGPVVAILRGLDGGDGKAGYEYPADSKYSGTRYSRACVGANWTIKFSDGSHTRANELFAPGMSFGSLVAAVQRMLDAA